MRDGGIHGDDQVKPGYDAGGVSKVFTKGAIVCQAERRLGAA